MVARSWKRRRPAAHWAALPLLLATMACGEGREPDPTPAPGPGGYDRIADVREPPALDPGSEGFTPGEWQKTAVEGAKGLHFAARGAEPVFRMYCHGRGGIVLDRLGAEAIGDVEFMEVQAGRQVTRLAVNELEKRRRILRSIVPFNDDLLVRLAKPDGMLSIKASDTAPLALPLTPLTTELIRACERPDAA